ncbi:MAG: class I SAM-dependent methyltransferase [Rhodobacterales bacterium]|nr:class I SAM-dependent methyltransferase [Rhodobacterales bacterium]
MTIDPETIRLYDAKAEDYAEANKPDDIHPILAGFIAALPENARVLDFGCGPGFDAALIAKSGARVDAMDASAEMVGLANAQKGVTAWQATFDDLDAPDKYHAILASFSFLHAPRASMPAHLTAIHRALKPRGLFHIALKTGTGEARDPLGRLYTYYTESELKSLLKAAGFDDFECHFGSSEGLDGVIADWITILTRKT